LAKVYFDEVFYHSVFVGEARTFRIVNFRDTIDPCTTGTCHQVELHPQARFRVVDLLAELHMVFRESSAKTPEKQWRKRKCPWKPISHAAPLQRQGSLEIMKLRFFPGIIPT